MHFHKYIYSNYLFLFIYLKENYYLVEIERVTQDTKNLNIFNINQNNIFDFKFIVTNSIFYQNFAQNGGALKILQYEVLIKNCIFLENFAKINGGALYLSAQTIQIFRCQFIGNAARGGGALLLNSPFFSRFNNNKKITLEKTIFYSNIATYAGGAAYIKSEIEGYFTNYSEVYFFKNLAYLGGSIILYDITSKHSFENCRFLNNLAEEGGVLYIQTNSGVYFLGCHFIGNVAIAIIDKIIVLYIMMYSITFINFQITSFSETDLILGAFQTISLEGLWTLNFKEGVENDDIDSNNGGVILQITISSELDIESGIFKRNMALHQGGVIYMMQGVFNEADSKYIENYSGVLGGVFDFEDQVEVGIKTSIFLKNSAGKM